jgi:hypothetical protein
MLFIVGGNDPIVQPRNVLDSAPPGGINMLEIAGLGHFIGGKPDSRDETRQRRYWMPEMGGVIDRFANEATRSHRATRRDVWLNDNLEVTESEATAAERQRSRQHLLITDLERGVFQQDGALPTRLFERYLDDLLERAKRPGYLFVLRNEVPAFLLDDASIQLRARALHHDDEAIVEYCRGAKSRRDLLVANRERIRIVLPWNARRILERLDAPQGAPSQAETAPGQMPKRPSPMATWAKCITTFDGLTGSDHVRTVMVFDGRRLLAPLRVGDEPPKAAAHKVRAAIVDEGIRSVLANARHARPDGQLRVPSLPDCWIWVSDLFLGTEGFIPADDAVPRFLHKVARAHDSYSKLTDAIRKEELRLITVSRARYNPRFRGSLVTNEESAKSVLLHAALCISAAASVRGYDWAAAEDGSIRQPRFMRAQDGDQHDAAQRA